MREISYPDWRIESTVLAKNDFTKATSGLFSRESTVLGYDAQFLRNWH
jgi:hypothetical protein